MSTFLQWSKELCSALGSGGLTVSLHAAVDLVCVFLLTKREGKTEGSNSSSATGEAGSILLSYQMRPPLRDAQLAFLAHQLPLSPHLLPFFLSHLPASCSQVSRLNFGSDTSSETFRVDSSSAQGCSQGQSWPEASDTMDHHKSFPSELKFLGCLVSGIES